MKKLLITLTIILVTALQAPALEGSTPIRFIYLNGSNTNTIKSKQEFEEGINNVHPYIKNALENSDFIKTNLLSNGNFYVEPKPETFFWGFESLNDLNAMDEKLDWMSVLSPKLAQTVRSFISHCMHDAIWVQKSYHMQKVINNLHKSVLDAEKHNEKVIMLGYSAGSFITYEYLIHKMPAINLKNTQNNLKLKPTCFDAIVESGLGIYTANRKFIKNPNDAIIKDAYSKLNDYTDLHCAPEETVLGVINYASPLALFYSDLQNQSLEINTYNSHLFGYLKKNDIFMLTVNFAEDPMGFPIADNLTIDDLQTLYGKDLPEEGHGFFYTKSDVKSPATFIGAHLSYWNNPKKFSKMISDGYVEGYKHFYNLKK